MNNATLINLAYIIAGAAGSSVAFWLIIKYILSKLEDKVNKDVFKEYSKRVDDQLNNCVKTLERTDDSMKKLCAAVSALSASFKTYTKDRE